MNAHFHRNHRKSFRCLQWVFVRKSAWSMDSQPNYSSVVNRYYSPW